MKSSGINAVKARLRRVMGQHVKEQGRGPQSALRDLLTDLRHLSDDMGLDFVAADKGAYKAYLAERDENRAYLEPARGRCNG